MNDFYAQQQRRAHQENTLAIIGYRAIYCCIDYEGRDKHHRFLQLRWYFCDDNHKYNSVQVNLN